MGTAPILDVNVRWNCPNSLHFVSSILYNFLGIARFRILSSMKVDDFGIDNKL